MSDLFPEIEPFTHGYVETSGGNRLYWEACGNPAGKSALVLHGGPGSGCTPWNRRLLDPAKYRIILFDQRNCGRSTPHASDPELDLEENTTDNLVADIEKLREFFGIDRWLVLGGSWGSLLALAYATRHPQRVSELVVFGVATGRFSEAAWLFRGGLANFFPAQWEQLVADLRPSERGDAVAAYDRRLNHPASDLETRQKAANDWCLWESATPDWPPKTELAPRFQDPKFALAFARIVTHYVSYDFWLEDGEVLAKADAIANIPGVIINGRYDFQSPIGNAWALHRAWPTAELVIIEDAGHAASHQGTTAAIIAATNKFAK